ncbi:aldo/keto reductase [Campylobacter hyointestinalis]|uniref:aldo/keto reductase n=1 Tax=Campylobacter hyointestinalis TaxID=198 RepID=UPI00072ADFF5|nr:aldo/keto reductase [Campylobacter hyointestinalis]CUU70391.1 aldo/keto reductase family oxidoreductase [Campylobacter hyointestinalis subsp. hyointestinalis]CUU72622.1 aldo/keto reductase family oxidoreductase [Campylobacter hyointestinalis subsp. hyointestinalis]CUU79902.1 aldo/keto reductase family oxidoreductase [Campylobacter hyointestinalis subsp. hyointestinalis]CUU86783.1 aldo/keto reductase family oxidoreductase [Campylobacter hyointestinalis subsp. hyointestinalis]
MKTRREFIKEASGLLGALSLTPQMLFSQNQGDIMQTVRLNNDVLMPILGYGVYQINELKECQRCVEDAFSVGYRSIDTAQAYFNEEAVGAAIKSSGIKREELFITTKLWISDANEDRALKAFDVSLKKLGLDYLDLYLIHQPFGDVYGAWRAMSKLYKDGKIRAIGVSNFYPDRLVDFCLNNEIKPAINQIECNPMLSQEYTKNVMSEFGVAMESWAPFGEGKSGMFSNQTIASIGKKYGKTNAQVILRWLIQRGVVVIPKTVRKERMIENISVFDFSLDESDMSLMAGLDSGKSLFLDHRDPEKVKFLNGLFR